jgi:hypothetical protein
MPRSKSISGGSSAADVLLLSKPLHYGHPMTTYDPPRYVPPPIVFDERQEGELAIVEVRLAQPAASLWHPWLPEIPDPSSSPFADYHRCLTEEGGILIRYKDVDRSFWMRCKLAILWVSCCGFTTCLFSDYSTFGAGINGIALLILCGIYSLVLRFKLKLPHSVEIRPDCMILDGEDVFLASEIGENWPRLEMKDSAGNRGVIAGVCGTRFIEYMTVCRTDRQDFTPEMLEMHLHEAMTQLWDRVEVSFDTAG